MEEPQELIPEKRPAITITIQSWATPIAALLMLIIGFYAGVYLRPAAGITNEQGAAPDTTSAALPQDTSASNKEIMDFLLGQERQSIGDPNAPVVMVGFSDFQ